MNLFLFSVFFLVLKAVGTHPIPKETFDNFKALMMYFNEPLLRKVSIKEISLVEELERPTTGSINFEGAASLMMANMLTKTIKLGSGKLTKETEDFETYLSNGVAVMNSINSLRGVDDISPNSALIQNTQIYVLAMLNCDEKLVIPSGWQGLAPHAIGLILEKAENGLLNLAVVNAGDGLQYHYKSSDPKGHYPFIAKLWIEFKGIPIEELFSSDFWFIRALAALQTKEFIESIEAASGSGPQYFYGSVLVNLRKYLVEPDPSSTTKMAPEQRSGSCSLSSLMACLLYLSESELTYHRDRVLIGHLMLKSFLNRYVNDSGFLKLIKDGYEPISRKLFRVTSSSLAQQAFLYLEQKYPDVFMNAGLLGKGRLTWTREKLTEALEILSRDPEAMNILKETLTMAFEIENVLLNNPIDANTTEIIVRNENLTLIKGKSISLPDMSEMKFNFVPANDPINFLKLKPSRPSYKIENIRDLVSALMDASDSRSIKVLDIFRGCQNLNWWEYLDEAGLKAEDIMVFWRATSAILLTHLEKDGKPDDFDDLLMLAHLQIADWKCALKYDELLEDETQRLGLSQFKPPPVLELHLSDQESIYMNLDKKNWHGMFTSFSAGDLDELDRLFKAYKQLSPSASLNESFPKPTDFLNNYGIYEHFFIIYANFFKYRSSDNPNTKKMYEQILNHPRVKARIDNFKVVAKKSCHKDTTTEHASLEILHTEQELFKDLFPHYFRLFNNMIFVYMRVLSEAPFQTDKSRSSQVYYSYQSDGMKFKSNTGHYEAYKFYTVDPLMIKTEPNWTIPSAFQLCSNHSKVPNGFYATRHSLVSRVPLIKFDAWFNNIKAVQDPTIFNDPYFLYLSDRILNMPLLVMDPATGSVSKSYSYLYFPGMTGDKILNVIIELMRLIKMDINTVIKTQVESEIEDVLRRLLNMSIIWIRFMGRLEHDGIIPAKYSAMLLSNLYNLLSKIKFVDEELTSAVNIVLTQICDLKLRDPKTFIDNLSMSANVMTVSGSALRRVHWFLAKLAYSVKRLGKSQLDDLFYRGFVYYPLEDEEKPATEALLKRLFLSRYGAEDFDWKFYFNGDMISIEQESGAESKTTNVTPFESFAIQLSSGNVVRNGQLVPEKSKIFNSEIFTKYFKDDKAQAKSGDLSVINSTLIYTVPDHKFKGNTVLIVNQQTNFWLLRNYNGKWYKLEDKSNLFEIEIMVETNYFWLADYEIYSHKDGSVESLAFMKDDDGIPLIHLKVDGPLATVELPMFPELKGQEMSIVDDSIIADKHLRLFTNTQISVFKHDTNLLYVFQALRLADDPKRQFVVCETLNGEFKVLNRPGWIVENRQVITGGSGMIGTLVIRNLEDGQRFITIPLIEKTSECNYDVFITIEEIPMSADGFPAPQTLQQKLLLAYTSIKAYEYDLARELLHPFTSMTHNQPFSAKEFEIIGWIMNIDGGGPKTSALLLMAYLNYAKNKEKFPLHYEDHVDKETLRKIDGVINASSYNYLLSLRDLPEKYYVYRLFPEFLDSGIISRSIGLFRGLKVQTTFSCEYKHEPVLSRVAPSKVSFGKVSSEIPESIVKYFTGAYNDEQKKKFERYLSLMSKLMMRQSGSELKNRSIEMVIYCAAMSPEFFRDIGSFYNYDNIVEECQKLYVDDFKPISFAAISSSTPSHVYFESLRDDMNSEQEYVNLKSIVLDVVKYEDLKEFDTIIEALSLVNSESTNDQFEFEDQNSKVLAKLKNSMAAYAKESQGKNLLTTSSSMLSSSPLSMVEFVSYLNNRIKSLNETLQGMAADLIMETEHNDLNTISEIQMLERLNRFLHVRKKKTFEALYACYQRQSVNCIHRKFTQLSFEKCTQILDKSTEFYSNQVLLDYLTAIRTTAEKLKDGSIEDLNLFLDELRKIKDFNSRMMTPTILNFEFRSRKYRLRSEQVNDINNFTSMDNETGNYKSSVIQRMMAAGKTLVLGTISVVMKALNNTRLSILVPPASLYQSNLSSMQARTYSYFKSKGSNFVFPRFKFTADDLKNTLNPFLDSLIKQMDNTRRSRDYLVLSPETLQSFLNSFVEALYKLSVIKTTEDLLKIELVAAIEKFSRIYNVFRAQSSIILDEIDMTMDPKRELNFPTNKFEQFNMTAVILLTDVIEFSVFDEEVKSIGLKILANNQSSFTADNFEKYREILFKYVRNELEMPGSLWNRLIHESSSSGNSSGDSLNTEKIMEFLEVEDISFMKDWIKELMKVDKKKADALIIVKVQIWRGIKDAMRGEANLNYGSAGSNRLNIEYAVPYVAANTPSPSSEFADRWETMNKTLLMLASTACTEIMAKNMINFIKRGIAEEITIDKGKYDTTMYKNASVLLSGINPLALNDSKAEDVALLHSALKSRSPAAIRLLFSYAVKEIFSKMAFPVEQITSNALNMTSMFGSIQGYSGTIDNVNILPREVIADAYVNHMENEKNNGGIALKLIKDSDNAEVLQLDEGDLKGSVIEIIGKMIEETFKGAPEAFELSALIDVGAFFKNFKNRQVAEAILTLLKDRIKVVLYYEEVSNQVEFVRRIGDDKFSVGYISSTDPETISNATKAALSERFTFYDQRHITGSDILQPKIAHALLTVGTRVLLRDILQGTLRMRQFMTSQTVHMVTSTATAQFYRSKVTTEMSNTLKVTEVLTLGALNEDEKQAEENKKLAFAKIDNEIRRFVLDEISRSDKIDNVKIWFEQCDDSFCLVDLFVRSVKEEPINWMSKSEEKDTSQVLFEYVEKRKSVLMKISEKLGTFDEESESYKKLLTTLETLISPFVNNVESMCSFLDSKLVTKSGGVGEGTEVESRILTEQLSESNLELLIESVPERKGQPFGYPFQMSKEEFGDDARILWMPMKKLVTSLYTIFTGVTGVNKQMARNVTITNGFRAGVSTDLIKYDRNNPEDINFNLIFSRETCEGTHLLVQEFNDGRGMRALLLSNHSANGAVHQIRSGDPEVIDSKIWICDLSGFVTATNDTEIKVDANIIKLKEESRLLVFDLLVFNGSLDHILKSQYLKQIYYETWLKDDFRRERARFLLLRMTLLMDKIKYIFAADNEDIAKLRKIEAGGHVDTETVKTVSSSGYNKPPIEEETEKNKRVILNTKQHVISKTDVNHDEIFQNIFGSTQWNK